MKKALILSLVFCFFMAMSFAAAAQTDKPAVSGHESHTGQDASKSAPSPDSAQPQAADHDMGRHIQMMQEHIQKMQTEMEKIKAVTDSGERQKLMREHMTTMLDGVRMMKTMPGCKMMPGGSMMSGCKMMPGGNMGAEGHGPAEKENMMPCHQMMGKKMEMMQSVMEGLIECCQMSK